MKLSRSYGVGLLLLLVLVASAFMLQNKKSALACPSSYWTRRTQSSVRYKGEPATACLRLEKVSTTSELAKGLSGRETLPKGTGMLFVFGRSERACIWMKDMQFPLDILWLDDSGMIIRREQRIEPDTYPTSYCQENTKYVIEVNAGAAQGDDFAAGQYITL